MRSTKIALTGDHHLHMNSTKNITMIQSLAVCLSVSLYIREKWKQIGLYVNMKHKKYLEYVFIRNDMPWFTFQFCFLLNHLQSDVNIWCYNAALEIYFQKKKKMKQKREKILCILLSLIAFCFKIYMMQLVYKNCLSYFILFLKKNNVFANRFFEKLNPNKYEEFFFLISKNKNMFMFVF